MNELGYCTPLAILRVFESSPMGEPVNNNNNNSEISRFTATAISAFKPLRDAGILSYDGNDNSLGSPQYVALLISLALAIRSYAA